MPRVLRSVLIAAVALTAWLVALPAMAASGSGAGRCSPSGTSEVAPTPVFMPSESSLEQGDPSFSCGGGWEQHSVQSGQERFDWSSAHVEATLPDAIRVAPPGREVTSPVRQSAVASPGVRTLVERPPRS
jgi:hypothetical protein